MLRILESLIWLKILWNNWQRLLITKVVIFSSSFAFYRDFFDNFVNFVYSSSYIEYKIEKIFEKLRMIHSKNLINERIV